MNIENIQSIQGRISQIQSMIHGRISSINTSLSQNPLNFQDVLNLQMNGMGPAGALAGMATGGVSNLRPQAQSNSISCGQSSVAMAINSITGQNLTDMDIDKKYGFELLKALNGESQNAGVTWRDGGTITPGSWGLIEQKVNQEQMPVIVALNGPEFSPSGRGHIVTITKIEGDTVYFADPAQGVIRTTTKDKMNTAPSHPDGNFIFYGTKDGQAFTPQSAMNMIPMLNQFRYKM